MDRTDEHLRRLLEIVQPATAARVWHMADGDALPSDMEAYDLVTWRDAARFIDDPYRFAVEARRVLKTGGVLALHDLLLPEDARAGRYIDALERLCEPQHVRAYSASEWRGTLLDADFTVERIEVARERVKLLAWAEGCTPYVVERMQILLAQAPRAVREWLPPSCVGTGDAEFERAFVVVVGKKET
jgi:SAM-dependent methyltransferase